MTEEQTKWLADHPAFAPISRKPMAMVSLTHWTDEGLLYESGKFAKFAGSVKGVPYMRNMLSDSETLFIETNKAIRVGREVYTC